VIHAFPSEIYPTQTAAWAACLGGDPWAFPSPTAFTATIQTRARYHCRPVSTTILGRQTFPALGVSERYFNTFHHTDSGWAVQYESRDRHRFRTRPREADGGRHRRRYPKRARNSSLNISARAPPEILGPILCWNLIPGYEFGGLREGSYNFRQFPPHLSPPPLPRCVISREAHPWQTTRPDNHSRPTHPPIFAPAWAGLCGAVERDEG
jgi:hypothetical protein